MRLLCIADHVDPLIYSTGLKERYGKVDLVLSAGDLALGYYDFIVSCLNRPLYFVFGNHHVEQKGAYGRSRDVFEPGEDSARWERSGGAICLDGRVVRIRGLIIAGLGGSIWYNGGENQFTDLTMFFTMLKLMPAMLWHRIFHGRYLDLLITHSPPYGINDLPDPCHTGFRVFLWFMRTFRPRYLVHGHVHLYDRNAAREATYGSTTVINAYDHVVIDLEASR
ncbi:MAG TPA: metallophosphoesterase [Spirochaetia bacterium]|nr:metallophosphoesterase [Spirochaetia bacterium]